MSYTVLARKYRPQRFDEIVGQEHVTRTIKNALRTGRIHHAFLFTGVRGVGKTTAARILAKALCCKEYPTEEPCNKCESCISITKGVSPDVLEIDGASNTGVDDVRELRETIHFAPTRGNYRIYIIDEVHMLSQSAFNALLKTLEEPPSHVKFIFATTEPHKLPATILSRVQRYDFRRLPVRLIAKHLKEVATKEGLTLPDEAYHIVARESGGSVRDSLSLLDQIIAAAEGEITEQDVRRILGVADSAAMFDMIEAIVESDPQRALSNLWELSEFGYDLRHFLSEFAEQFRNLAVASSVKDPSSVLDLTDSELESVMRITAKASKDQILRMFHILSSESDQLLKSPFPQLVLEVMILRMCEVRPVLPIQELIEKIEKLGSNLPAPTSIKESPTTYEHRRTIPSRQPTKVSPSESRPNLKQPHATNPQENQLIDSTTTSKDWKSLVEFIQARDPIIGSIMYRATPLEYSFSNIKVRIDPLHIKMVQDMPEFSSEVQKLAAEFLNSPSVRFETEPLQNSTNQAPPKQQNSTKAQPQPDTTSAENEPTIKETTIRENEPPESTAYKSVAQIEAEEREARLRELKRMAEEAEVVRKIRDIFGEIEIEIAPTDSRKKQ